MRFRIAKLFELITVVAVFFTLLKYIPPLGLMLPSLYVSFLVVTRSIHNGNTQSSTLMKIGAASGITTMYTVGLIAMLALILPPFFASQATSDSSSWLYAILIGFLLGYGAIGALLGALIGQWAGMFDQWSASRKPTQADG
ncbi:hypothetical protein [Planctomycetes bacterium K23_9]|uniref:Uncharacterized protein n=1 Tax=Stieleria marina TaxID=1930275 RepID=A0A517NTS9_9BACT|nr:hypothetical protein K239x_24930 [Planctomycetes bacterium K23_9]